MVKSSFRARANQNYRFILYYIHEILIFELYTVKMPSQSAAITHHTNTVLQLNLGFFLLHFIVYGSTANFLLNLHNPFADFVVMLGFTSFFGILFCLDYLLPTFCEAINRRDGSTFKVLGWMMIFSLSALISGIYQVVSFI